MIKKTKNQTSKKKVENVYVGKIPDGAENICVGRTLEGKEAYDSIFNGNVMLGFPYDQKQSDIMAELLKLLNSSGRNIKFWIDMNGFGNLVGIVPVERFYKNRIGSIYQPYNVEKEETCLKFVVIDVDHNLIDDYEYKFTEEYLKKKKILEEYGMNYIKNFDINVIYNEVLDIV